MNTENTTATFNVRQSDVRRAQAWKPVTTGTVIDAREGFPGWSDKVTLQPGERLEMVEPGSAYRWSVVRIVPG